MNEVLKVSPSYIIDLIDKIEKTLWAKYDNSKYRKVLSYIKRWQVFEYGCRDGWNDEYPNFVIDYKNEANTEIDLVSTLSNMDSELLFQIAIDLNIEIPNLIYSIAEIKGLLSNKYNDVSLIFEEAVKKVYEDPSHSIVLANSALETIVKRICKDKTIKDCSSGDTLYKLISHILKEFKYFPDNKLNAEIRNIGSGLLKTSQSIENIRSNYTKEAHGKLQEDYIIKDPLYAMLIVNSMSTIGLFLLNFYEKKYVPEVEETSIIDDSDFDEDIPF